MFAVYWKFNNFKFWTIVLIVDTDNILDIFVIVGKCGCIKIVCEIVVFPKISLKNVTLIWFFGRIWVKTYQCLYVMCITLFIIFCRFLMKPLTNCQLPTINEFFFSVTLKTFSCVINMVWPFCLRRTEFLTSNNDPKTQWTGFVLHYLSCHLLHVHQGRNNNYF